MKTDIINTLLLTILQERNFNKKMQSQIIENEIRIKELALIIDHLIISTGVLNENTRTLVEQNRILCRKEAQMKYGQFGFIVQSQEEKKEEEKKEEEKKEEEKKEEEKKEEEKKEA